VFGLAGAGKAATTGVVAGFTGAADTAPADGALAAAFAGGPELAAVAAAAAAAAAAACFARFSALISSNDLTFTSDIVDCRSW